jgi:hypothetical protein
MNNFGLVEEVESMQVLYADDRDGDEIVDGWVTAGSWLQESDIRAVKVALLISTTQVFDATAGTDYTLLDQSITTAADGRLRTVSTMTTAIRGRLR